MPRNLTQPPFSVKEWAIAQHANTNHTYGGLPYSVHLQQVVFVAQQYIHLLEPEYVETVINACWCHDLIEDCRITYNELRLMTNYDVAEIVYALTNDKGRDRNERAGIKYYDGIRDTKNATFVKLCDRIANIKHSKDTGSRMYQNYCKENAGFKTRLYKHKYKVMFDKLDELCKQ